MKKTFFIPPVQIGESYVTKAFIDAWCAHLGIEKKIVTILQKPSCKDLFEIVFAPEGYVPYFWDPSSENDEADKALAQTITCGEFSTVIHIGSTYAQPWIFRLCNAVGNSGVEERIYVEIVFGDAAMRSEERRIAQYMFENRFYTNVVYLEQYDEVSGTNIHYLNSLQAVFSEICSNGEPLQLPSIYISEEAGAFPSPYVVCNIGAGEIGRQYPAVELAKVIVYLLENKCHVVITGMGEVDARYQINMLKIIEFYGVDMSRVHPMVNCLTLSATMNTIKNALFTITNDTGVANLTHGMGCPQLVLCWTSHVGSYFPYTTRYDKPTTRSIWTNFDCPECNLGTQYGCRFFHTGAYPCLATISSHDIITAVQDWIAVL